MNILQENYLEQYSEELELLNFKLDRMHEAAFGAAPMVESTAEVGFSLLEDVDAQPESDEPVILNEAAYDLYTEALGTTLKNVWKAIIRMVKATFVSSGYRISGKEAHTIVNTLKEASEDGKVDASSLKNMVQKGFYLIAGLGTSLDGQALKAAYENGSIVDYVSRNIGKVNLAKLPQDANFRIAIGTYESNVKNSMAITGAIFKALSSGGIKAVEKMAAGVKDKGAKMLKKESVEDDEDLGMDYAFESFIDDLQFYVENPEGGGNWEEMQMDDADARRQSQEDAKKAAENTPKKRKERNAALKDKYRASQDPEFANKRSNQEKFKSAADQKKAVEAKRAKYQAIIDQSKLTASQKQEVTKVVSKEFALIVANPPASPAELEQKAEVIINNAKKKFNFGSAAGKAVVGGAAAGLIALGIVGLVQKVKANKDYGTADDHIAMATIVFVNESQTGAMAKIRLYSNSAIIQSYDIKGKENVAALQNDLEEIATKIGAECDNLSPGIQEALLAFGNNITTFFAGLTTKKSK